MENPETIPVEVIYALPGEQRLFSLRVIRGASVLQALQQSGVLLRYPQILTDGRLASAFNPSLAAAAGGAPWVSAGHYGLDQGIVLMMIENHRSGLPWQLMRGCPYLVDGLRRAGFRGGWLQQPSPHGAC